MCSVAQLYPTLYDSIDSSLPGSFVHGFSSQEYWSGLPFLLPGDLPDTGIKPSFLRFHWQVNSLPLSHLDSPESSKPRCDSYQWLLSTNLLSSFPRLNNCIPLTSTHRILLRFAKSLCQSPELCPLSSMNRMLSERQMTVLIRNTDLGDRCQLKSQICHMMAWRPWASIVMLWATFSWFVKYGYNDTHLVGLKKIMHVYTKIHPPPPAHGPP